LKLEKIFNFNCQIRKKTKFTESQIVTAIKKQESGISAREISRELGINPATFYNSCLPAGRGKPGAVVWK
jgi:hypothetical protein